MENSVSIGNIPPILEQIFVHLPIASLNKCARVCKLWNSMVKVVKRKKREIFWMYKVQDHEAHRRGSKTKWYRCPRCRVEKLDIGSHFHEVLQAARSEPKLGIMFLGHHVCNTWVSCMADTPHQYFRDCARVDPSENGQENKKLFKGSYTISPPKYYKPFLEYLSKYLPNDCNMIILTVPGIIGTSADCSRVEELVHADGFASVFLPALPGLETFQFIFSENDTAKINAINNEDNIPSITGIPKDKELKCLLLFQTYYDCFSQISTSVKSILKHYQKQNNQLAVGGGIILKVISPQKSNKHPSEVALGLAFAGEGIEVASVFLDANVETPKQVFEKMHDMRTHCKFSDNCVAFMFSDNLKSNEMKVQVEVFREFFPRVPIFGGYLSLAFCDTYCSSINPEMFVRTERDNTTVFIILSVRQV